MYEAEVAKNQKLETDLKAHIDEKNLIEDTLFLLIEVDDTPQQRGNFVHCGAAILYIMRQYLEHVPISKKIGESELPEMRTEIVKTLMNYARGRIIMRTSC